MTHIYISTKNNKYQDDKYVIEIESRKIEFDYAAEIQTTLKKPKSKGKWPTDPTVEFLDLLKRAEIISVTGRIDKYSNRDTDTWTTPSEVNDVGVVRKRLKYMSRNGGLVRLYIGTGDGYYNRANNAEEDEYITGMITKIKFIESTDDHVDRTANSESYPSAVKERTISYELILTIEAGTLL